MVRSESESGENWPYPKTVFSALRLSWRLSNTSG